MPLQVLDDGAMLGGSHSQLGGARGPMPGRWSNITVPQREGSSYPAPERITRALGRSVPMGAVCPFVKERERTCPGDRGVRVCSPGGN